MTRRQPALLDRCLAEVDTCLRVLAGPCPASGPAPGVDSPGPDLPASSRLAAANLMRVNHAGEVAAQALYRGQAFTTRDLELRRNLLQAAADEQDHLAWCRQRVAELGGRTSVFGPLWYAGSFFFGALAGLAGREAGLGFVVETERQVEEHLTGHLDRLPEEDLPSRAIVGRMRADEAAHGAEARRLGAVDLPEPVRAGMRLVARVMTTVAGRI